MFLQWRLLHLYGVCHRLNEMVIIVIIVIISGIVILVESQSRVEE